MIPFIDLKAQYNGMKKDIDRAVKSVFSGNSYILGKEVKRFESLFAVYCGSGHGIGVASGTEALYLALAASGIGRGDEVITAPNTTAPTVAAIYMAGALPVFADIDPATLTIDPVRVRQRITRKTKAVIPVHLYGNPADMDGILHLARPKDIAVIEDACQAHGAFYKGGRAGSIGDIGCFSFYPTKNLGCYGDGGMIVTDSKNIAERLKRIRVYGEMERYKYTERGINSRLDELQAAILSKKLKYLDRWNKKRAEIASIYDSMLRNADIAVQKTIPGCKSAHHLYVIQTDKRDELKTYLGSRGIQTLIHYPEPLYRVRPYAGGNSPGDFPVCEYVSKRILSLPIYPEMSMKSVRRVAEEVIRFERSV